MILGTSRAVRVYAYPEAVDLRKGYDGQFGLVTGVHRGVRDYGDCACFADRRKGSELGRSADAGAERRSGLCVIAPYCADPVGA